VQAFVSAQAGRISQIVAMVVEARDALSRYLETTAEKIPLRGVEPGGVAVFEHDRARFVVVDQRVGADHGRRPPASGCGSCPIAGVRASDEFLGFVIHTLPG